MIPFNDPPRTADEETTLLGFLNSHRAMVLWKLEGLDEEQARRSTVDSGTSPLGVVKHLAWVERWWFVDYIGGKALDYPWSDDDPDADWRIEDEESIASISRFYADCVGEANEAIATAESLDATGPEVGSGARSLRWVLVHMIEETARHLGHMDILIEQVADRVGYMPGN